jgi:hypothetical protein
MKLVKMMYTALSLVLLGGFIACGNVDPPPTQLGEFDYPSTPPAYTGLPDTRPQAKVLTQFAADGVTALLENGELRIKNNRSLPKRSHPIHRAKIDSVANIQEGMILVSPPTEEAPFGFIKKVTKVEVIGGETVFQTTEATLAEAVAGTEMSQSEAKSSQVKVPVDAYFQVSNPDGTSLDFNNLPKRLDPKAFKGRLTPQFDIDIIPAPQNSCRSESPITLPGGGLTASGCIRMRLWISVDVDLGWWWWFPYLQGFGSRVNGYFGTNFNMNLSTSFSQQLSIALPGDFKFTLVSTHLPTTVFWVGPIPIVITSGVAGELSFGGQFSASASVSATLRSSLTSFNFNFGSEYDPVRSGFYCGNTVANGYWGCRDDSNVTQKVTEFENQMKSWQPLQNPYAATLTGSANANLSYKAKLSLVAYVYLYGALGLDARVEPYVKPYFNTNISANAATGQPLSVPEVRLSGGINAGIDSSINGNVNLLFINLSAPIVSGPLVPETELLRFLAICWKGDQRC